MKKLLAALALIQCAALAACGGGGGGGGGDAAAPAETAPVPAQAPAQAPAAPPPIVIAPAQPVQPASIAFYGDSTIYGYTWSKVAGGYVQADPTAPHVAGAILGVEVNNRGIAGSDTNSWLTASEGAPVTWAQEMSDQKAPTVVLQWGINDIYRGVTVDQFTANLSAMIVQAQNAGKVVYIETANPTNSTPAMAQYVAAETAMAATYNVKVIDEFDQLSANPKWPSMLSDGTHPTPAGYKLKGQIEAAALGTP